MKNDWRLFTVDFLNSQKRKIAYKEQRNVTLADLKLIKTKYDLSKLLLSDVHTFIREYSLYEYTFFLSSPVGLRSNCFNLRNHITVRLPEKFLNRFLHLDLMKINIPILNNNGNYVTDFENKLLLYWKLNEAQIEAYWESSGFPMNWNLVKLFDKKIGEEQ